MTPRLRAVEVGVRMALSVFGFQKSFGNPNFGFDFLATVRFGSGFLKSETERTFGLPHIPNKNRVKKLELCTVKYRRARGDMIKVFKILLSYCDNINNISLLPHVDVATRGNKYKLYQSSVKYDLRKHLFTNRVVSL